MRGEKKDVKYWLSIILMLVSVVAMFMRIENRLTKIEERLISNRVLNDSMSESLEKRIVRLEELVFPARR